MQGKTKLALFDIDGTIAVHGEIPKSVIDGIHHLHHKGYITTVSTGRGYIRLKEMLGDLYDTIISPEALIIIEHGTKIVDRYGNVIFGEFLNGRELDHIVDFIRANIQLFKLAWFNPEDVSEKMKVWCIDEKDVQEETEKRGHYADVFTCTIGQFQDMLLNHRLTNVTLRLKDYVKVENLKLAFTRTDTNVIFQDSNMEFVKNNINKGIAVEYVAKHLNISNVDLLIAGNAINDVEMLDVGAGTAILVSTGEDRETILSYLSEPDKIIKVDTPHDLGNFLLSF
jgi:HAD superfamily hydrolase (TIGR01484 family)